MQERVKSPKIGKRILVVDDEPGILRFVRLALASAGYEVSTTKSGEKALQLAQSEKLDLILLDVVMVPISGFDILVGLRAFSQVPVIMFTARGIVTDKALEFGANATMSKPFRPDELIRKVRGVLESEEQETAS